MQIKYVVSTVTFWGKENRLSFEQDCQLLKAMGFGVELWPTVKGHSDCRYERLNWPRLAAATEEMTVSMYSRNDNPSLEQWNEQIECAKMLDANIVTNLQNLRIPDTPEIENWDFADEVIKLAEINNVPICLEVNNLMTIKEIGERFKSVYYCLDTGIAHLDPVFTFKQYVSTLAPRIAHLHLSDNYGHVNDGQPPGLQGGISRENWHFLLEELNKYNNRIIGSLEMSPPLPAVMIRQAGEFLFDDLQWPGKPQRQPKFAEAAIN